MKWVHTIYMKDNVTATYVPASVMAADIYTKEYSDVHKWKSLCEQISVFFPEEQFGSAGVMETQAMYVSTETANGHAKRRKLGKDRVHSLMPPGFENAPSKKGVHVLDDGRLIMNVRDPRLMRTPPQEKGNGVSAEDYVVTTKRKVGVRRREQGLGECRFQP